MIYKSQIYKSKQISDLQTSQIYKNDLQISANSCYFICFANQNYLKRIFDKFYGERFQICQNDSDPTCRNTITLNVSHVRIVLNKT